MSSVAQLAPRPPAVPPRGSGFAPEAWAILAESWYPVALAREIVDKPVSTRLLDQPLVLYRTAEGVVVAPDLCPHRGVPLSMGSMAQGVLVCAYHGLNFGAGGRCLHMPAHPDRAIPAQFHLRTYPAVERYGLIWTCLAAQSDAEPVLPPMPHWDEPDYLQFVCPWIDIKGFAGRQVEGFLDVAHFAFVHTGSFALPDNSHVPRYQTKRTIDGFEAEYWSNVSNFGLGYHDRAPADFLWLRHYRCHVPFAATLEIHFPEGGRLAIMNAASPVSLYETRLFSPMARNFDHAVSVEEAYDFNRIVFEEDRALVEAQRPVALPLDPTAEVHLPADMSSMAYRRALRDLGLKRFARDDSQFQ